MKAPEAQAVMQSCYLFSVLLLPGSFFCSSFLSASSSLARGFGGSIERVDGAVRPATGGQAGVLGLDLSLHKFMCFQLSTCGSFVKKLGVRFLLFFSVYCGLCLKWDANVIYSARQEAGSEDWALRGHADWGREDCT